MRSTWKTVKIEIEERIRFWARPGHCLLLTGLMLERGLALHDFWAHIPEDTDVLITRDAARPRRLTSAISTGQYLVEVGYGT